MEHEEPRPRSDYMDNRPSARTEVEREAAYQNYLERSAPYMEKIRDDEDKPWFRSEAERRELYFRRYTRPEPPAAMPAKNLGEFRG